MAFEQPLVITDPDDRLDRTVFDPRVQYESVIHVGHYVCPGCGHRVGVDTSDFLRRFRETSSNLHPDARQAFDAFRPLDEAQWEGCLDFHCPGCDRPARLVFRPTEFAMGAYYFTVVAVVEPALPTG